MIFITNHLTVIFLMQNQLPQLHDLQGQAQQKFQSVNFQQAAFFLSYVKTYRHMHTHACTHPHIHWHLKLVCLRISKLVIINGVFVTKVFQEIWGPFGWRKGEDKWWGVPLFLVWMYSSLTHCLDGKKKEEKERWREKGLHFLDLVDMRERKLGWCGRKHFPWGPHFCCLPNLDWKRGEGRESLRWFLTFLF